MGRDRPKWVDGSHLELACGLGVGTEQRFLSELSTETSKTFSRACIVGSCLFASFGKLSFL